MARTILIAVLISVFLAGCSAPAPDPALIESIVKETMAAMPTQTAYPTHTANPTYTPQPTYTKAPTNTPIIKVVTATSTSTPMYTPTETQPPTATFTTTPTTNPLKNSKRDGIYIIGIEIAPGVWDSDGTGDGCYWEVSTSTGDIISNHFGLAGGTAYVQATGFQVMFQNCGTWTWLQD